jgi:hypothetical protein
MSTPNIVNVTTINGNTAVANVITSNTTLLFNAVGSNQLFKVNALYIANANANSNTAIVSTYITRNGSNFYITNNISVAAGSTLDIISKSFYMNEGDALNVVATANNSAHAIVSLEIIS